MKKKSGWKFYRLEALNKFDPSMNLEVITPETVSLILKSGSWKIADPETGLERTWVCNGHKCVLYAPDDIPTGALIRIKDSGYVSGKIRVT